MKKELRKIIVKETIIHFIKWYFYVNDNKDLNQNVTLKILDNYIDGKHYDFNPFEEINN